MQDKNPSLGPLGAKFFAYIQMKRLEVIHIGELQKPFKISALQERKLFFRLNKNGFIFRLLRGVYLVPKSIPPGGYWRPKDYLIVSKYMGYYKANYYIGGMTAFNKYGFFTQIPNQLSVYNDKISGLKKFGSIKIRFNKVAIQSLIGFDVVQIESDQETVNIANLARTILDGINYSHKYQTLPCAYEWLKTYLSAKSFLKTFIELLNKSANNKTIRRIGYYLEQQNVHKTLVESLLKKLQPTKGLVSLIPNGSRKGKINKKWGIIDNA